MAAVALQRELDAYNDTLNTYNRQLQNHNSKVTKYNSSFFTNDSGQKYVYKPASVEIGYTLDPTTGQLFPHEVPVKEQYYVVDPKGNLKAASKPAGTYGFTDLEKGYQALRVNPDEKGLYPTQPDEWTKEFNLKQPTITTGQMKRLDEPSLIDVERNADRGLISNAFNF